MSLTQSQTMFDKAAMCDFIKLAKNLRTMNFEQFEFLENADSLYDALSSIREKQQSGYVLDVNFVVRQKDLVENLFIQKGKWVRMSITRDRSCLMCKKGIE